MVAKELPAAIATLIVVLSTCRASGALTPDDAVPGLDGPPPDMSSANASQGFDMTSAAMEAAITDLMLGKTAFGATPMGGSVKKIKDLLTKTMMPKVIAAHKADQNELNRLVKEIYKCGRIKDGALKGAKPEFAKYRKESRFHKSCRTDEAVKYTSKTNCLRQQRALYQVKKLKCKTFADISKKWGTTKNNKGIVNKGASESAESYVRRLSTTFCGRHIHGTKGTKKGPGGWGGGLAGGALDQYLRAKEACRRATRNYNNKVRECKRKIHAYNVRKAKCNQYQKLMDSASCKNAVMVKDACESYAGCYHSAVKAYRIAETRVRFDERDRKAEWRGLKRMSCLINAFADGKVTNAEIDTCKKKSHSTAHLNIKYPKVPPLAKCVAPRLYPATGAYKRAEFAPLPSLAKGRPSTDCSGMEEISTTPMTGSPKSCKVSRVSLNGFYSAGPMVKVIGGWDVRRSRDRNSCPKGTKIFSPATRGDWKTFLASAGPVRHPHWIIDVTRPQNGCGGCTSNPMNSKNRRQKSWRTSDGSPWWLRSTRYSEPNGDYSANCFLDLWRTPRNENSVTFNDGRCNYHSRSYYCQKAKVGLKPRGGSPSSCKCSLVDLTGSYSAGMLVKCEQCITVYRSSQKNSCPVGMKIFSPRSRGDWSTFIKSAGPLRAPHWIIDVTRPQNGCGGCTRYPMKSTTPQQATWRTSDRSPWWLRNSRYNEPNGDYSANCFLDLWRRPNTENNIQFNDHLCNYRSRSYYCQPMVAKPKPRPPPPPPPARRLVSWSALKQGVKEEAFYFGQGRRVPNLRGRRANMVRRVANVNYRTTGGNWPGFSQRDNFAVRWTGFVLITRAGSYRFRIESDDGSKLWIDNRYTINNDGLHGMRGREASRSLVKGQHSMLLKMFERGGHAGMIFKYRGADTGNRMRVVSGNALKYVRGKGFLQQAHYGGTFRNFPNFNRQPAMTSVVPSVAYLSTVRFWPNYQRRDDFATRWIGYLQFSRRGRYKFRLESDDGSKLYVNNGYTINNGGLHGMRSREAYRTVRGSRALVRVEHFEHKGGAGCMFYYMGADTRNRMIVVPGNRVQPPF